MNSYFLLVCLMLMGLSAGAQNYYVTSLRGKVTYQKKVLKKRDKIQIKGELRFSTNDDWVKVAGPGGIYTLRPERETSAGNEFFTALREELFPKVRLRGSFANSFTFDSNRPDYFGVGTMANYFNGKSFPIREELVGFEDDLRYIFKTEQGIVALPVKVKSGTVTLHHKIWKGIPPLTEFSYSEPIDGFNYENAGVVVINDEAAFTAAMDTARTFNDLGLDFSSCAFNEEMRPAISDLGQQKMDSIKVSSYAFPDFTQPMATGTLLSFFAPDSFLDRKEFDRELRFLIRKTQPQDAMDFLDNMQFDTYIRDNYGYPGLPVPLSEYIEEMIEKYVR